VRELLASELELGLLEQGLLASSQRVFLLWLERNAHAWLDAAQLSV